MWTAVSFWVVSSTPGLWLIHDLETTWLNRFSTRIRWSIHNALPSFIYPCWSYDDDYVDVNFVSVNFGNLVKYWDCSAWQLPEIALFCSRFSWRMPELQVYEPVQERYTISFDTAGTLPKIVFWFTKKAGTFLTGLCMENEFKTSQSKFPRPSCGHVTNVDLVRTTWLNQPERTLCRMRSVAAIIYYIVNKGCFLTWVLITLDKHSALWLKLSR